VHPAPPPPCGDKALPAEIGQVTRDFWLAHLEDLHKIANADLLIGHEIKEAKARAIGQGAKEKIEGERFILPRHGRNYIWLDRYDQGGVW